MKRTLFCALLAAAALSSSAFSYRAQVPVQVDGTRIADGYIENGSTYVSLRALLGAMGDWDIRWDGESRQAAATLGSQRLTVSPAENTLTLDGERLQGTVHLEPEPL